MRQFFVGVDGGATKCIVRVENEAGELLGRELSGPANIRLSVEEAWQSIYLALEKIGQSLGVTFSSNLTALQVGMGLAGCEVVEAYQAFIQHPHGFGHLKIASDAHVACLGAHSGRDGAILVIGTGTVGYQIETGVVTKVGGWGFPHDDIGGGAWLGLEAVKMTLQWLDKRLPPSALTKTIYAHFEQKDSQLMTWSNQANSTAFAKLAPLVIECAKAGDACANLIMQKAAENLERMWEVLIASQQQPQPLPCSLIGGVSPYMRPYLSPTLQAYLFPCELPPDAGALLMIREHYIGRLS